MSVRELECRSFSNQQLLLAIQLSSHLGLIPLALPHLQLSSILLHAFTLNHTVTPLLFF